MLTFVLLKKRDGGMNTINLIYKNSILNIKE